jgi:leader peptidase (prepilin peptidase)/N-methyltransferase
VIPDGRVLLLAAAAGLALGSFVGTAALRSTQARSALRGRSCCDGCGAPLGLAATVPIVSYIGLRGACARCGARIDAIHLVAEASGAVVLAGAALSGDLWRGALLAVLGFLLLALGVIDAKTQRLPDPLTAGAALCCALLAASRSWLRLEEGLAWAAGAVAVLLAVRALVRRPGGEPGLGLGDVKLAGALALWLGPATPWMILLAAFVGLAFQALTRPADGRLPFGPALAAGAWVVGIASEASWLTM